MVEVKIIGWKSSIFRYQRSLIKTKVTLIIETHMLENKDL